MYILGNLLQFSIICVTFKNSNLFWFLTARVFLYLTFSLTSHHTTTYISGLYYHTCWIVSASQGFHICYHWITFWRGWLWFLSLSWFKYQNKDDLYMKTLLGSIKTDIRAIWSPYKMIAYIMIFVHNDRLRTVKIDIQ